VDPPEYARLHLQQALRPLRNLPGAPSWTEPHRWHVTLLFLAAVRREVLPALVAGAGAVVAVAPAMQLRLAGGGRFGPVRRPQVAWAGVDGDVGALSALADGLTVLARGLYLTVEDRPFRPHVTLGRWAPRRAAEGTLVDRLAGYRGPSWPVTEVRLWHSLLGPVPRYEKVTAWPVG
jgi:2'-5' RNA ligase